VDPGPGPRARAQQLTRAMGPGPVSEPFVGPRAWVRALEPKKNKNPNKRNGACIVGTPKIYTATGFGPTKNTEMAGVNHLVVYMQPAVKIQHFLYTPPRGREAPPGVVYIQTAVFYSSLHIHHQKVHTSLFPIFSWPRPGGGVYISLGPPISVIRSSYG